MATSADPQDETAERYRSFALREVRGMSPSYEALALRVAGDADLIELIDTLPPMKRQPNLVFSAARFLGAPVADPGAFREWLLGSWDEVREVALARATQTNEAARCAPILPLISLAAQGGPVALLEVGVSAGLDLYPDRYSYRYATADGTVSIDPPDGESPVVIDCAVTGPAPIPDGVPEVVWRAGIDLHPLDAASSDDVAWLDALIWPEHEDRRRRLRAAAAIAAAEPPRMFTGDLVDRLQEVAAHAPAGATLVVFHTAVLMYLAPAARGEFAERVAGLPGHWISNEWHGVSPLTWTTSASEHLGIGALPSDFELALDGRQLAFCSPHGRDLRWLS